MYRYLRVGGLRGTINFPFWESHSLLLDFVEAIRAEARKRTNQRVFNKRFHIQLSAVRPDVTPTVLPGNTAAQCVFPKPC